MNSNNSYVGESFGRVSRQRYVPKKYRSYVAFYLCVISCFLTHLTFHIFFCITHISYIL